MAKGSVRKKGKKWYYRYYVEDASGNLVQKECVGTESKSETEKLLRKAMEEYETDITDKRELQIRDAMSSILNRLPFDLNNEEADFSKDLLLLMLQEYELFMDSFQFACKNFKGNTENADIAATIGFESNKEYNEIMFLREITHTVNAFNDMAEVIRLYSKKPETATQRLANLLSKDSESV